MFQLLSSTAADVELAVPVVPALGDVPHVASCAPPIPAPDREVPTATIGLVSPCFGSIWVGWHEPHPVPVDYSCRSD